MPAIINSDNGVVSGIAGLKTSGASDGITAFQQNGTEQARITAAGLFQFNSGYGSVATAYGCRAWVNFDGTGTVAIRASGNVTSVTDNGTGDYTVNFTTALVDANYSSAITSDNTNAAVLAFGADATTARTTTALRLRTANTSGALTDAGVISVAIFR